MTSEATIGVMNQGTPSFDDDSGYAQAKDEGEEQVEWGDPGRQADAPQPERHEAEAADGRQHGEAVGHDFGFFPRIC